MDTNTIILHIKNLKVHLQFPGQKLHVIYLLSHSEYLCIVYNSGQKECDFERVLVPTEHASLNAWDFKEMKSVKSGNSPLLNRRFHPGK